MSLVPCPVIHLRVITQSQHNQGKLLEAGMLLTSAHPEAVLTQFTVFLRGGAPMSNYKFNN